MELVKGIEERRSIRKFKEQKVPRELITEIVVLRAMLLLGKTHR